MEEGSESDNRKIRGRKQCEGKWGGKEETAEAMVGERLGILYLKSISPKKGKIVDNPPSKYSTLLPRKVHKNP